MVVAIIGILAAVGVVAYSGYTQSAKRNASLAQHQTAIKFIKNSLGLCDVQGGGTLKLSNKRSINCNIVNNSGNINNMNDLKLAEKNTFKKYKQDNFIYNTLSILRERINAPTRRRK